MATLNRVVPISPACCRRASSRIMGTTIEVYRQRIGCYNCRGPKAVLRKNPTCPTSSTCFLSPKFALVIAMLLLIAGVEPNPGPEQLCKYCNTSFQDIGLFCDHSKIHQSSKNFSILCGFPNCAARLSSVASYRTHVSRSHVSKAMPKEPPISTSTSLPCPVSTCTVRITSRQHYSKHMVDEHLKKGYSFICIFEGCETKMNFISQFRTHLSRYHRDVEVVYVAPESHESDTVINEFDDTSHENDMVSDDDISHTCNMDEETDLYPDSLIKEAVAKFYLKLEAIHVLASSTVQAIADEVKVLTELSHYRLKKAALEELKKTNLEKEVIASIVERAFKEDTVFNVHHKHEDVEQLGTHWSRTQFWRKYFPFVEVEEINQGSSDTGKSSKAHYVSIRQSLEILLKDPKVKAAVLQSFDYKSSDDQILSDYMDGTAYKEHLKQHGGNPCLQVFLFQDAFDFNPFGPSSGVYKPVRFYFSLGNLPAVYRSKVDLIQLVYMILENDFKPTEKEELEDFDKVKHALKPLLDELRDLKTNGIEIDGKKIPVCLMFLLGDSLGQNTIGGYVKNFSSCQYSCRFCPMSRDDFKTVPFETKPLRTVNEYNHEVTVAKRKWCKLRSEGLKARKKAKQQAKKRAQKLANRSSAPSKKDLKGLISKTAYLKMCRSSFRGVKYRPSAFNSNDLGFHVVGHQPPCLAHDLFEGIVKSVVAHVLKYFIETKGWFDLACLNRRIKSFKCKGADAKDAPAKMKTLDKLGGNAVQNWNLLRFLPLMIFDLIEDPDDPMWQLFLLLKQIVEFVCAPRITLRQLSYLQYIIELYLAKLKDLLPSLLTEKNHYLAHYPELTMIFGPLIRLFTLRFESKHSFFKTVMRACKSFKNVTYTMANKYVCRFAYDHGSADLLPLDIVYNSNFTVGVNPDLLTDPVKKEFPKDYDWSDVEELPRVFINGIDYSRGFIFVLGSEGTNLKVGCIEKIFLQRSNSTVQFLLQEKLAENTFNGFYIVKKRSNSFGVATLSQLPDYYALPTYEFGGDECLVLKHTVTTME